MFLNLAPSLIIQSYVSLYVIAPRMRHTADKEAGFFYSLTLVKRRLYIHLIFSCLAVKK